MNRNTFAGYGGNPVRMALFGVFLMTLALAGAVALMAGVL